MRPPLPCCTTFSRKKRPFRCLVPDACPRDAPHKKKQGWETTPSTAPHPNKHPNKSKQKPLGSKRNNLGVFLKLCSCRAHRDTNITHTREKPCQSPTVPTNDQVPIRCSEKTTEASHNQKNPGETAVSQIPPCKRAEIHGTRRIPHPAPHTKFRLA